MSSILESIKADITKKLQERIRQASVDNFKMFQEFLEYEKKIMLSSASKKVVIYDPKHAELTQRDVFKKIVECTNVTVNDQEGPNGTINSKISVTCEGLDLSEPYILDSFQKLLNNVDIRMHYNIRS